MEIRNIRLIDMVPLAAFSLLMFFCAQSRHSVEPTTNVSVGVAALEHEESTNNNTIAQKTIQMGLRGVPMIRTKKRKSYQM